MRGLAAEKAQVARGVHESGTEVVMPEAIREHAGGNGVVLGNPVSQRDAAFAFAGVGLECIGLRDEVEYGETGRDDLTGGLGGVAALVDKGEFGFGLVCADPGRGHLRYGGDALIDVGEVATEQAEALGFIGCGDLLADAFKSVGGGPGFTVVGVGDLFPFFTVERDEHLVFGRSGAQRVIA